jgi:hypothetical protein
MVEPGGHDMEFEMVGHRSGLVQQGDVAAVLSSGCERLPVHRRSFEVQVPSDDLHARSRLAATFAVSARIRPS